MLNKRFKIAKCKTSLKLATSRIKLMKNKKGVQITQMKRELAQLLESGQDRTARIRVEHVIREEKMVGAYDLIEIYCELIVARLTIIESQKTCPIDLKEAITSVIFAAPRCADIPELVDVKKQFAAKYGKEFVSAALELRPDCGVGRMLVEKLSAIAPDVQTKMKVLSAVAKDYNINWDPTSFEEKESKPLDDLLNGPTNFEKPSMMDVDPPKIHTSNIPNVRSHEENPNVHFDFSQQNRRYTLDAQNITTPDSGGIQTSFPSTTHDGMTSSGRENWNMEFKDATSAAQAAAESAERASMAARAAALLSSQGKITRQYSTESHIKHERSQVSGKHQVNDTYITSPKATENFHADSHVSSKSSSRLGSLRSRNDPINKNLVNNFHQAGGFVMSGDNESPKLPNLDHLSANIRKQPSISPSRSHSTTIDDDLDVLTFDQQKVGEKSVLDQEKVSTETTKTSSYGDERRDDETESDDDARGGLTFDTKFEYDEGKAKSFFPSPGRESIRPLEDTHILSPKMNTKRLSENSAKSVDLSATFDVSDGSDSSQKVNSRKSRIELNDLIERGSSFNELKDDDKSLQSHQSSRVSQSLEDNNDFLNESDVLDAGKELKFRPLTGGLRNKGGLKYTPYTTTDALPSFKKPVAESLVKVNQTSESSSFNSSKSILDYKKPNISKPRSESDTDSDPEVEFDKFPVQSSKIKSLFAPPDAFFNDDETDSDKEVPPVPKLTSTSRVQLGPGLSRRTKGQVEPMGKTVFSSGMHSYTSESPVEPRSYSENYKNDADRILESSETSSTAAERKSSKRSYSNKSLPEPRAHTSHSKQEDSQTTAEPKISEQTPNPPKKIAESGKTEPSKTSNVSSETSIEANNVKKPSHVHPKLPDYDSLAAHIQSLRTNHQ